MPGSRSYKYFGCAQEVPVVKELFDELKLSKETAEAKDEELRLRVEMRRNVDADYYGFNRDEDDGRKEAESFRNVERAGEGAPIPGGWVVPGLDEVTEFLERRKSGLFQKLG